MNPKNLIWLLAAAAVLVLPLLVSTGFQHALVHAIVFAIFAASFNLASGAGGMLSFGHSAFLALGAFATLHVMRGAESGALVFPTVLLPLVGGVTGLLVGVLVGYFATLRSGVYFSMLTLAFAELFHQMAPNLAFMFGGETGISTMRMPSLGLSFASDVQVYYLVLAWGVLCMALLWLYMRTPFGRLSWSARARTVAGRKLVEFELKALRTLPPGGIELRGPWPKTSRVWIDGRVVDGAADEIRLLRTPARVRIELPAPAGRR